jgi:hypothetical protein
MQEPYQVQAEMGECLKFDATFESGNLDRVVMVSPNEYDLYMRPDSNTRGHHQWFYFKATSNSKVGTVKFNVVNFTKHRALFEGGMRIALLNVRDRQAAIDAADEAGKQYDPESIGWVKGGKNIAYGSSKLNAHIMANQRMKNPEAIDYFYRGPFFYQMSFEYDFNREGKDETFFAYHFPYTFTRLCRVMKQLKATCSQSFFKDATPLCQSLSGIDVPHIVVTSRAN